MPNLKEIEEEAALIMGFTQQSIGKTQARKDFLPLVASLSASSSAIEITDHDKPVAILLSYQSYMALATKVCMLTKAAQATTPNLVGSIEIKAHNLEGASNKIAKNFKKSVNNSAASL